MPLPEAYRSLPRPSSPPKPSHPPSGVVASDDFNIPADACANPMHGINHGQSDARYALRISPLDETLHHLMQAVLKPHFSAWLYLPIEFVSKEVIRLQVPLQPPCYDFSPLAELRFDHPNKRWPRLNPTRVKRRAVCARSRDVFTAR